MNRFTLTLLCCCSLATSMVRAAELHYTVAPGFFDDKPGGEPIGACHGGAVIDHEGNIYVSTDTPRGILVYSHEGKFIRSGGPTRVHGLELRREGGTEYIY